MGEPKPAPLMGRLAVRLKMITMDQLAEATREQGRHADSPPLGDILVSKGFIDRAQLARLVATQKDLVAKARKKRSVAGLVEKPRRADSSSAPEAEPRPQPGSQPSAQAAKPPSPALPNASEPASESASELAAILDDCVGRGASDVHLHSGAPIRARISGRLEASGESLDPSVVERLALGAMPPAQRALFEERGEIDFCHTWEDGRFRVNVYRQQRGTDAVFRVIPPRPPTLEELGLPTTLARYINYHQGMVLIAGPTGCGKSSTLAALVNLINEERREHILTIEDPIETVHPQKRCLVNQRSVGPHTVSFAQALRAALREDPDVIVIGELRDLETISLALSAAETGHLVLATLHTDNAIRTVNRLVGAFPSEQQDQIRTMLSESLRAVICQRLIPRADGDGRVPALETLVVNKAVGNLIRENKTFQLHSILQTGASQGMGLMDQSIRELVASGVVSAEDARRYSDEPRPSGA